MKKTTLIYALVALLVLSAIVAMAQGRRAAVQPNQAAAPCFANCQKALGLTQAQVAEMTSLKTACMNETAGLRADLQAKMKEIAGLWAVADPDLTLIKQKAAEADLIRAEIREKCIDTCGAVLKVLTPKQRAKCIKLCQTGQCGGCGMCCGLGMGMGMCGMGAGNAAGVCPLGNGPGRGAGMGLGAGRGGCCGWSNGNCPLRR